MPAIKLESFIGAEHAGQVAHATACRLKGFVLNSTAGVGVLTLRHTSASGEIIGVWTTTAEVPTISFFYPGDYVEDCPAGIYYSLVDSTGTSVVYVKFF